MKKLLRLLFILGYIATSQAQFITIWETTEPDESILIPVDGPSSGINYNVDWGDGTTSLGVTANAGHSYENPGTYTVTITGDFPQIAMIWSFVGNRQKLKSIEQWGDQEWRAFDEAFTGCFYLTGNFSDVPNVSKVEFMYRAFRDTYNFNGDISQWDTGNVISMGEMFRSAFRFNQNIGGWDTSKVRFMGEMFQNANDFNQDIGGWNTSNVERMENMFKGADNFDQDLSSWDVSKVTDMTDIFSDSGLSTQNYDAILISWSKQNVKRNVTFGAEGISYCSDEAAQARADLIDNKNWTITDSGQDCSTLSTNDFITNGEVTIFPNPTTDHIIITNMDLNNSTIFVTDVLGKTVAIQASKISESNNKIDFPNIVSGLYFLNIKSDKGFFNYKFLVK